LSVFSCEGRLVHTFPLLFADGIAQLLGSSSFPRAATGTANEAEYKSLLRFPVVISCSPAPGGSAGCKFSQASVDFELWRGRFFVETLVIFRTGGIIGCFQAAFDQSAPLIRCRADTATLRICRTSSGTICVPLEMAQTLLRGSPGDVRKISKIGSLGRSIESASHSASPFHFEERY